MLLCDASFNPHSDYTESWAGLGLLAFGPHLTPTLFCFVMQEGWQPPLVTGSWQGLGIQKPWGGKGCRLEGSHAAQPPSLCLGLIFSVLPPPMSLASLVLAPTWWLLLRFQYHFFLPCFLQSRMMMLPAVILC